MSEMGEVGRAVRLVANKPAKVRPKRKAKSERPTGPTECPCSVDEMLAIFAESRLSLLAKFAWIHIRNRMGIPESDGGTGVCLESAAQIGALIRVPKQPDATPSRTIERALAELAEIDALHTLRRTPPLGAMRWVTLPEASS